MELVYTQQQQQQIKEEETKFLPATIATLISISYVP
jgi:hypothetical protein